MLTPKEKAKELYDKYLDEAIEADAYFLEFNAKRCAKIAVEECLQTCVESSIYYWKEVLTEIENI